MPKGQVRPNHTYRVTGKVHSVSREKRRKSSVNVYPTSSWFKPETRRAGFNRELTPVGRPVRGKVTTNRLVQKLQRDRYGHIVRKTVVVRK